MKTLVSGIIGAVATVAAWAVLKHTMQQDFPYLAVVVGLVTGIAVRSAAGSAGESIGRGALSALLALGACVGGDFAYVQYMKNVNKDAAKPQELALVREKESANEEGPPAGEDPNGELAETDEEDKSPMESRDPIAGPSNPVVFAGKAPNDSDQTMNLIWLSGAGLLAYIVGKGGKQAAPASEDSPDSGSGGEDQGESQQGDA